jgi:hypothetical protein
LLAENSLQFLKYFLQFGRGVGQLNGLGAKLFNPGVDIATFKVPTFTIPTNVPTFDAKRHSFSALSAERFAQELGSMRYSESRVKACQQEIAFAQAGLAKVQGKLYSNSGSYNGFYLLRRKSHERAWLNAQTLSGRRKHNVAAPRYYAP